MADFNAIAWIKENFPVMGGDSASFVYASQDSLSNRAMPGIYQDFNPSNDIHVRLRGRILDYGHVFADCKVLDFGPGEGFPSLLIAPYVSEVVGVEGSERRFQECTDNARRLGIDNASFALVRPGESLPFPDASFDGAVASWSLEQSPDLAGMLQEICRILRPGGCFRFEPETLGRYAGQEQQIWLPKAIGGNHALTILDRDFAAEQVIHYALLLDMTSPENASAVIDDLTQRNAPMMPLANLTKADLKRLRPFVLKAGTWVTCHPSYASWPTWLHRAGFSQVKITYSGSWAAEKLLEDLQNQQRPRTLAELDQQLTPLVQDALEREAVNPEESAEHLFVHAIK